MSYQWPIDPDELFGERYAQILNSGLPAADVDLVRSSLTNMWSSSTGGWTYEWSALAEKYSKRSEHLLAATAYGWAKFPTLADESRDAALRQQTEHYLLASNDFGVTFTRRTVNVPFQGRGTTVPVHLFTNGVRSESTPVVMFSGGVDTWKMDFHNLLILLTRHISPSVTVMAFDLPGTGESAVPMTAMAGGEIVNGLADFARQIGNGFVAHCGVSMGGYFSARTGLSGAVDAAIVLGGPVLRAFDDGGPTQFGMAGIVGNALGFSHPPSDTELRSAMAPFPLQSLLDDDNNAPMLVINGADDVHVPQFDTLIFEGRRATEVHLLPDTGHCATTKFPEVVDTILTWLARILPGSTPTA